MSIRELSSLDRCPIWSRNAFIGRNQMFLVNSVECCGRNAKLINHPFLNS